MASNLGGILSSDGFLETHQEYQIFDHITGPHKLAHPTSQNQKYNTLFIS